ncbi:unnamed protein product [Sphenostylis stenocarpa]|uniref:Uncharacterized protein n=1 Tax=Sphenostylis stenocarpa TaxID=92480 RepID=A0AA86VPP4_9FABA|nr:unnamed protein product [Sphenostylis stenocarpa]
MLEMYRGHVKLILSMKLNAVDRKSVMTKFYLLCGYLLGAGLKLIAKLYSLTAVGFMLSTVNRIMLWRSGYKFHGPLTGGWIAGAQALESRISVAEEIIGWRTV